MKNNNILIIGSSNTDMVVKSDRLPAPGETIIGGQFFMFPGGKGANQAVAAARMGGNISYIGKVGNDMFGEKAVSQLKNEGIDVDSVFIDNDQPSGVALISVDSKGENSIVVASGANSALLEADINKVKSKVEDAEIILMQLEIPVPTIEYVAGLASKLNKTLILNPAPATLLSDKLLSMIDIITPNETEAEILTGVKVDDAESAGEAADILRKKGIKTVIITLGSMGAFINNDSYSEIIPAFKVEPMDTTAAGDTFNGAFAVAISEGHNILNAVKFANKAASVSVTRMGAQSSIPLRSELNL